MIEKQGLVQTYTYGNVGNGDLKAFVPRESNVASSMSCEQRMAKGARRRRRRMAWRLIRNT